MAQTYVDTAWVRRYNGPGSAEDEPNALAVDANGNVYVTGYSAGPGPHDYTTIKYAPNGDTLWVRKYNGAGSDIDVALALAADGSGNVYVTGYSWGGYGTSLDYATIKYTPNGDTLWVRRYNGPGNYSDVANALVADESGNVYVTGYSEGSGTSSDYTTIKYSASGDTLWVRRYNGPGNSGDAAFALAIDVDGNVYVTGYSYGGGTFADYATIKYAPNGDSLWVRRYDGPGSGYDQANALTVDDSGNVYVTGVSVGSGTDFDYATIKYSSLGDTLWVRRYNGPGNGIDEPNALAVDDSGNLYVTGHSEGSGFDLDYTTIKYSSSGDTLWVRRYNGPGNGQDAAFALAVDDSGNVYVTGVSDGSSISFPADYATMKYAPNGDTLWNIRYTSPGLATDQASDLAVDDSGNVYVTGHSWGGAESITDYVTIKYVHLPCIAKPGDANSDGGVTLPDIIFLVNRVFKGGPAPSPLCRGDANADGNVTLPDIIYLVNQVFKGGPAPLKSKECCL